MFGFKRKTRIGFTVGELPRRGRLDHVYARPGDEEAVFLLEKGDRCIAPGDEAHIHTDPASGVRMLWIECLDKGSGWVFDGVLDFAQIQR